MLRSKAESAGWRALTAFECGCDLVDNALRLVVAKS